MAAYTHTTYSGTTGTFEYAIGWSYARSGDVKVYVDGVLDTDWYFSTSGTKIKWTTPDEPQTGETFEIRRVTVLTTAATVFSDGSGLTAPDINVVINQLLYAIDELQVPAYDTGFLSVDTLVTGAVDIEYLHNLGAAPTRVSVQLKCTSTELGYATNDIVQVPSCGLYAFTAPVSTTAFTASYTCAAAIQLPHATTGAASAIDDTKWSYRILAWV